MLPQCVLVGRPNAGKSTLFNRLTGRKHALVHEQPGMTRDWRGAPAVLDDLHFMLMDTPGLFDEEESRNMASAMTQQTTHALHKADVFLFMIDGMVGASTADKDLMDWLRKFNKPILLLLNKAERKERKEEGIYEFGVPPLYISALEGHGLDNLAETLSALPGLDFSAQPAADQKPVMQLAIIGRPNVGKSTLINGILKEERLITSPHAGSTRDSIALPFLWQDKPLNLIDTAGIKRYKQQKAGAEKLAAHDAKRAIRYAPVVGLVVDATCPLEQQDLTLAKHVIDEGRVLFIIVNKIDLIKNIAPLQKELDYILSRSLAQAKNVPIVYLSAMRLKNIDIIFKTAFELYELWNKRISTHKLNQWLQAVTSQHQPPMVNGRRVKIRFITQIKTRPPTFIMSVNKPEDLPKSYVKYLENQFREDFDMVGIPLRLIPRKKENPYVKK